MIGVSRIGAWLTFATESVKVSLADSGSASAAVTVKLIGEATASALVGVPLSTPVLVSIDKPVPTGRPLMLYRKVSPSGSEKFPEIFNGPNAVASVAF